MTPEATATPKKQAAPRDYVVLGQDTNDKSPYRVLSTASKATSAEAAIKEWVAHDPASGVFVAVPKRNWQAKSVKVETKTTLKLS